MGVIEFKSHENAATSHTMWSSIICRPCNISQSLLMTVFLLSDGHIKSSHMVSPEILRALTELFINVENVAEVCL